MFYRCVDCKEFSVESTVPLFGAVEFLAEEGDRMRDAVDHLF